jgi:hypothetical protein
MKYALRKAADDTLTMCSADGQTLPETDADRKVLHILPKFFCPELVYGERGVSIDSMTLTVISRTLAERSVNVCPEGGIKIRQPYPNTRYFVGGSVDLRVGWMVVLPVDLQEFDLSFEWRFESETLREERFLIRHQIDVELLEGVGNTYSMDPSCWHRVVTHEVAPCDRSLYSVDSVDRLSAYRAANAGPVTDIFEANTFVGPHIHRNPGPVGIEINERAALPALKMSDLWTLSEFDEEQIHEVRHAVRFDQHNVQHNANACVEMPASVFVSAVKAARRTTFGKDSAFAKKGVGKRGHCETHETIELLCAWWNQQAPHPEFRCAGFFMPWVRVRDDGEYWAGYYETPNAPIDIFGGTCQAQARVANLVLIEFAKGSAHFTYDMHGIDIYSVTGARTNSVGVGREEVESSKFDEAWYTLEAMRDFPHRFPAAWNELKRLATLEQ